MSESPQSDEVVELRDFLIDAAFQVADAIPEVLSLNIVGTFAESGDLSGISDIDVVIVLDHLTEWKFREVMQRFESASAKLKSTYGLQLRINSTFGPLKFNEPDTVVYHVMVYDIAGHALHCRKSPFTCWDWERTSLYTKRHLSEIHSVYRLMPCHFFSARRGVEEYLGDYNRAVVSYRSYRFCDGDVLEDRHEKTMTVKDRYEFAFHILRFVMANFLKVLRGENELPPRDRLVQGYQDEIGELIPGLTEDYAWLLETKLSNRFSDDAGSLQRVDGIVHEFLAGFEQTFRRLFPSEKGIAEFRRHARTSHNRGTRFLGQRSDPEIEKAPGRLDAPFDRVLASPALRANQTAAAFCPDARIETDLLLQEMDYGLADGEDLSWLMEEHPEIPEAWARGEDPPFPEGESQNAVAKRVQAFLDRISSEEGCLLIVSHNVWLRALVGTALYIPLADWYRIRIPHEEALQFRRRPGGGWIPDLPADQVQELLAGLETRKLLAAEADRDPQVVERAGFWQSVVTAPPSAGTSFPGARLVPMAGEGRRFQDFGFETPKPLIDIDDRAMVERAIADLPRMSRAVYLVREHMITDALRRSLERTAERVELVPVRELTEGQACTCLLGMDQVDADAPLLIAPCDNGMQWDEAAYSALIGDPEVEVICWTFTRHFAITARPEAWGYVKVNAENKVQGVSVKRPFTNDPFQEHCVIGTFWFRSAALFQSLAGELIRRNQRVNGEFYVDSIVGLAAELGHDTRIFDVDRYISWGNPADLFEYRKWKRLAGLYDLSSLSPG